MWSRKFPEKETIYSNAVWRKKLNNLSLHEWPYCTLYRKRVGWVLYSWITCLKSYHTGDVFGATTTPAIPPAAFLLAVIASCNSVGAAVYTERLFKVILNLHIEWNGCCFMKPGLRIPGVVGSNPVPGPDLAVRKNPDPNPTFEKQPLCVFFFYFRLLLISLLFKRTLLFFSR